MNKFLAFLCLPLFVACATTYKSSDSLVNNPKTFRRTFIAPMNYQKAFRVLAEMSRKCLQVSLAGNKYRTEEKLDTDKKRGEIWLINHNLFWGDDYFGYYVVRPHGNDQTELVSYHQNSALGSVNDNSKTLQEWLGGRTSCSL